MTLRLPSSLRILWLLPLMMAVAPAWAANPSLSLEQVWARPTAPGQKVGAVYLIVRNAGPADRLLRLSTPVAADAQLHQTQSNGGVMSMRRLPFADVPAGGTLRAEPGGLHIMLLNLRRPLAAGEKFMLTLVFAHAGPIETAVTVGNPP